MTLSEWEQRTLDETFDEAEEVRRMERRQGSIERAYVPSPKKCRECGATWNPDNADSCPLCELDEALRMDDGPEGQEDDR